MGYTLKPQTSVSVGQGPREVVSADVNGDGKADLLVASSATNTVSVRLGNGDGTFASAADVAVGPAPTALATADVNGDGKADLLVVDANGGGTGTVSVRLGTGTGTFTNGGEIAVGTNPASIAVADVNGDGKADFLVANRDSGTVSVLLGNGSGGFAAAADVAAGSSPASVTTADLNGDGKTDLLVADLLNDRVSFRLGTGTGTFIEPVTSTIPVGHLPSSVVTADVNGDGATDVISANSGSGNLSVRLGRGNGLFDNAADVPASGAPVDVTAADVDGDGNVDLVFVNQADAFNPSSVSLRLGNGDGTFRNAGDFGVGNGPVSVTTADVNGDGNRDVLVSNGSDGTVSVLLGQRVPPKVTNVAYGPNDGALGIGESIQFIVTLSNAVTVTNGSGLNLHLNDGGIATYDASASTSTQLVYRYVVTAGQSTADLAVTAYEFNGARVRDAAGDDLDLSGVVGNPAGTVSVDGTVPRPTSVTYSPATGAAGQVDTVLFSVALSEPVIVANGSGLNLHLSDGGLATYDASLSDGTHLVYRHAVDAGQELSRFAITGYEYNGASVRDAAGNAADLSNLTIGSVTPLGTLGDTADNLLSGSRGNDQLDGGAGADTLVGFAGDDIYTVDNVNDRVVEASGGGYDRVLARTSYTLTAGQEIEALLADVTSSTAPINLTGNDFDNVIAGSAGANVLDGGAGADTMAGYGGDDIYVVNSSRDRVIEAAGGGYDRVLAKANYELQAGQEIEVLSADVVSGNAALSLVGNEVNNAIIGTQGANLLDGRGSSDILQGYGGADSFRFSLAPGSTAGVDRIVDFSHVEGDRILISGSDFGLSAGTLPDYMFKDVAARGADADDRVLYNHDDGGLYLDRDGLGGADPVRFATLDNKAMLTAADITVI